MPERFNAQGATVYRLNIHSEFRRLESIIMAKTSTGLAGARQERSGAWRYLRVTPDRWHDLEQAARQCRFGKMSPTAPPYALGGVGYSIERREDDSSHEVFRVNPENAPGEKEFMTLVRVIREVTDG
jgi:hypothetical protein